MKLAPICDVPEPIKRSSGLISAELLINLVNMRTSAGTADTFLLSKIESLETNESFKNFIGDILIGKNVWVGANVTVLSGVTIGENSVIGAGAVVTKSIPKNSVAVGIPAKVIKKYA